MLAARKRGVSSGHRKWVGGRLGLLPVTAGSGVSERERLQDLKRNRRSTYGTMVSESHVTTSGPASFTKAFPGKVIRLLSLEGWVGALRGDKRGQEDLSVWRTGRRQQQLHVQTRTTQVGQGRKTPSPANNQARHAARPTPVLRRAVLPAVCEFVTRMSRHECWLMSTLAAVVGGSLSPKSGAFQTPRCREVPLSLKQRCRRAGRSSHAVYASFRGSLPKYYMKSDFHWHSLWVRGPASPVPPPLPASQSVQVPEPVPLTC